MSDLKLATRLSRINEPQTIKMAKLSRELRAQGIDVIDLSLGEPDFATPQHIQDAATKAMQEGFTKYPPVAGFLELREAIVRKFARENQLTYQVNEVMACTGAKQCIANAMMCLLDDGDEVIIPSPYWVTYGDLVKVAGGNVVEVKSTLESDFKITPTQLREAINSKTKVFIFSSPCNPSGSLYSRAELEQLAVVFREFPQITIISDEIYEHINFEGTHCSIAQLPDMQDRTIVINGLSKAYAMTGWRLGYMAAPAAIITACEKMQSQFTSGANSITQRAAITALDGGLDAALEMVKAFKERRDFLVSALNEIPGLKTNNPPGAFYVFPDVSSYFGKKPIGENYKQLQDNEPINNSLDLCLYLLHQGRVSCVSGEAFGDDNHIRISYATNIEKLKIAVVRIKEALALLQ
jgi:aspartate aminotransferase